MREDKSDKRLNGEYLADGVAPGRGLGLSAFEELGVALVRLGSTPGPSFQLCYDEKTCNLE